jgi:hypothetical protein
MKKEFAIKALKSIKEHIYVRGKLLELGVDISGLRTSDDMLHEAVAMFLLPENGNEKTLEAIIDDITWWLYEDVDKVINVSKQSNGKKEDKDYDVTTAEQFIEWACDWYANTYEDDKDSQQTKETDTQP